MFTTEAVTFTVIGGKGGEKKKKKRMLGLNCETSWQGVERVNRDISRLPGIVWLLAFLDKLCLS